MAQAVRYFTEVLLDRHIPFPPGIDQEKIGPGSKVEVILMLEDDSERELEALLASFRRGTDGTSEGEVREIVDETVAAERKADPILRVAGCLSGNPLSADQIEKELYGMVKIRQCPMNLEVNSR